MVYAFSFIDGHRNAEGKVSRLTCCSGRIEGGELASGKDVSVQGDLQVKRTLHGQILRARHSR
jgi:hypothetical protein